MLFLIDVNQNSQVGEAMEGHHEEDQDYQFEEVFVVLSTNAIVEPHAVVVKVRGASVALATVLGLILDMGITDLTVIFESSIVKGLTRKVNTLNYLNVPSLPSLFLSVNGFISRIGLCG